MRSRNLICVSVLQEYDFTIRVYADARWGWRKLGCQRYALDLGYLSLVFEHYYRPKHSFWG